MRTKKSLLLYKKLIILIGFFIAYPALAQPQADMITRTVKTTPDCNVSIESNQLDVSVNSWAQNELKVEYTLQVEGKTAEDKKLFLAAFTKLLENQLKESLSGKVTATVQIREINQTNSTIKIRLKDDPKEYKLSKFGGSVKILVPAGNQLHIGSNFNQVSIGDFTNDVYVDINSADFTLGSCKKLVAKMNFAQKSTAGKVEMADIDCNSSSLSIQQVLKDLTLEANFSNVSVVKIGNKASLNMNSSSFVGGDVVTLLVNGNFVRNCKFNNVESAEIEMNSSEFTANRVKRLTLKGVNFSNFQVAEVGELIVSGASSSNFNLTKVASLRASDSNFCNVKIGTLTEVLQINASSGDLIVDNVQAGFKSLDIKGTFVTTKIKMAPTAEYSLYADLIFPDYNFGSLSLQKLNDDSNHEIIRAKKGNGSSTSQINLNCQNCSVSVK